MSLSVVFGDLLTNESKTYRDIPRGIVLPPAWRIDVDNRGRLLPMPFGRQRDAEAAKAALEKAGLATREALLAAGRARFEQVMIEALQW